MTISINSIKVDVEAERNGEFKEIPEWPGVKLGVRSLELPAYKIALDQLVQKYQRRYKGNKSVPPDVRDSDIGGLVAKHILFGWEGFKEQYTPEYATELLTAPEGRNLLKQAIWAAGQVGERDVEFVEETAKNSATPSDTN